MASPQEVRRFQNGSLAHAMLRVRIEDHTYFGRVILAVLADGLLAGPSADS
jgi:hypothetical protein